MAMENREIKREIKFRAWSSDTKEMIPWEERFLPEWFDPDYELILLQYTGLKDKNGNEIWEGDIIAQWDKAVLVKWNVYDDHQGWSINTDDNDIEVLGNLYEHPSLLKG